MKKQPTLTTIMLVVFLEPIIFTKKTFLNRECVSTLSFILYFCGTNNKLNMSKISIYQVLPRLFGNKTEQQQWNGSIEENGCGKMNDFDAKTLKEIKQLGISHVWYTGIIEHATQTDYSKYGIAKDHPAIVKGKAGSAYAIKDYYDIDPDLAVDVEQRMLEFENLVARTHKAGMKVIIDFVPNHVARQYKSDQTDKADLGEHDKKDYHFHPNNNFYYFDAPFAPSFDIADYNEYPAKATGNDRFTANPSRDDWYETVKLNYGIDYSNNSKHFAPVPDTWHKMLDILMFWAAKKVDGFRCDMAEMVPVEFWDWAITKVKEKYGEIIFIAEVYNPALYRAYIFQGKFDYLYDKVGLYDKLRAVVSHNHAASDITHCWQQVSDIQNHMLNFLENHDEQRIASGFFAGDGMYAKPAMIVSATLTKAPVMVYFGQELGEKGMQSEGFSGLDGRTSIFDYCKVDSIQRWYNNGKFGSKLLKKEEVELQSFYKRLLNLALTEKAISEGEMYDLTYANFDNKYFNTHEQFAYFRKFDNELLLIVLNFDDKALDTKVNIPVEAIEHLNITTNVAYTYTELLESSGRLKEFTFSQGAVFETILLPWSGNIFKFDLK